MLHNSFMITKTENYKSKENDTRYGYEYLQQKLEREYIFLITQYMPPIWTQEVLMQFCLLNLKTKYRREQKLGKHEHCDQLVFNDLNSSKIIALKCRY